eukprot:scaffold554656_cov38-Prasinocladus_malaysianus.AAC.1
MQKHCFLTYSDVLTSGQLISHPRVRAVVTHCGWGACLEILQAGKPMVGLPSSADQPHNASLMQSKGVGIKLNLKAWAPNKLHILF